MKASTSSGHGNLPWLLLVATADRADKDHEACRQLLESDEDPLGTTAMVIAEAA